MNHDHHREVDASETPHHRKSDDIIIELLDIVQRMDARLENHINEEMRVLIEVVEDQNERYQELVENGFPKSDPAWHKRVHESLWEAIKGWFK